MLALLIPAWLVPLGLALNPVHFLDFRRTFDCLFGVATGEEWQEACVTFPAMMLWWVMLVPLIVLTIMHPVPKTGECPSCGYSTIGLHANRCPECGTNPAPQEH